MDSNPHRKPAERRGSTDLLARNLMIVLVIIVVFWFAASVCLADEYGDDPLAPLTLEEAVTKARQHSYLTRAAGLDYEGALEEKHQALADFLPKLQASYRYASLREQPYMITGGFHVPVAHKDQYHWNATIIQPLFTGFALTNQFKIAELQTRVREHEQKQVDLDVTRNAKTAFYNVLLAEKILEVRDQAIEAIEAQEADSKKFYDQELIPLNDLLRAQVALANARQEMEQTAAQLQLARVSFNLLLGIDPKAPVLLEDVSQKESLATDLDHFVSLALGERPVLLAGKLGLDTLEKAVIAAQSNYLPHVSAFASYEQNGDNPMADHNEFGNRYNSSAGIQAEWNVFQWGKTRSQVAKSRLDLRAAQERIKALEDQVRLEVESAYRDLEVASKNIQTAQQALEQARENWRITRLQYQEQMATSTEVLDAQTYLSQADTNYYLALYGYLISLADLERAVGLESIL